MHDLEERIFQTPQGPVTVEFLMGDELTNDLCATCEGTKGSIMTVVHTIKFLLATKEGEFYFWKDFQRLFQSMAQDVRRQLAERGIGSPICAACMVENMRPDRP